MADTEKVLEIRLPRSKKVEKKPKFKSIEKIIASDGFRIDPDLAFNRGGHSVLEFPKTLSPQYLHPLLMADTEEVPENRLPRSKKVKKKPKCKSIKKIIASDEFRIVPDLGFNGCGHSVFKRYGVPPFRLDDLKSFCPQLDKNKEELIGLLSSKKEDEKLRKILINQKDGNIGLDDCINFIWNSMGIIDEPNLPQEEEAEGFLLKQPELFQVEAATEDDDPIFTTEHPVFADTSAESESRGGIESGLMALIKNLEQQMACITDLIRFLEVDGSTKGEMDRVIRRLLGLLENERRNIPFLV